MIDDDQLTVADSMPTRKHDYACVRCIDRCVAIGSKIHTRMPRLKAGSDAVRYMNRIFIITGTTRARVALSARTRVAFTLWIQAAFTTRLERRQPRLVGALSAGHDKSQTVRSYRIGRCTG